MGDPPSSNRLISASNLNSNFRQKYGRHFVPTPFRLLIPISNFGGVCWTKFETISSKIQMIKNTNADEARRNYLSGGMDSPCLG